MSKSWSTTNYSSVNTPLSIQDSDDALAFAGSSGVQVGGQGNVNGSNSGVINLLDAGAVSAGIGVAKDSVTTLADLTTKFLSATRQSNLDALNWAGTQGDNAMKFAYDGGKPDAAAAKDNNKTILIALAIAGAVVFFIRRKAS